MESFQTPGGPEPHSRHSRRGVLGAGAFGLVSFGLPAALSAASAGVESQAVVQPAAPTGVSGVPIGYVGSSTGAIRVSWSAVTGAASYQVAYSTNASGPFTSTANTAGTETSLDLTGLSGTATTYYFVVRTSSGGTLSGDSSIANSSNVIATGGTVTSYVDGSTSYAVHTFTATGESTLTLNSTSSVEYLIVGGGGGGGSGRDTSSGGGGGAGMVRTGTASAMVAGSYSVVVGSGGSGGTAVTGATGANDSGVTGDSSSFHTLTSLGGGGGKHSRDYVVDQQGFGGDAQVGTTTAATGGWGGQNNTKRSGGSGGGGGGAGGAGGEGSAAAGGTGGAGVSSSITGSTLTYGAGGPGAKGNTQVVGAAGTNGRGNGGGAGSWVSSGAGSGGNGGSGVVVLRYAIPA